MCLSLLASSLLVPATLSNSTLSTPTAAASEAAQGSSLPGTHMRVRANETAYPALDYRYVEVNAYSIDAEGFDDDEFMTRCHRLVFARIGEHVDLAVERGQRTGRVEDHTGVVQHITVAFAEGSPMQPDSMLTRQGRQCRGQWTIQGLGMLIRRRHVESGDVPQLGQQHDVGNGSLTLDQPEHPFNPVRNRLRRRAVDLQDCHRDHEHTLSG